MKIIKYRDRCLARKQNYKLAKHYFRLVFDNEFPMNVANKLKVLKSEKTHHRFYFAVVHLIGNRKVDK